MRPVTGTPVQHLRRHAMGLGLLLLAALSAVSSPTQAAQPELVCTGNAETIMINMPPSIPVPRDAVVGQRISEWVRTAPNTSYYRCQINAAAAALTAEERPASGVAFRHLSLTKARGNLTVHGSDSASYSVWDTSVPGVGIAIGVRIHTNERARACGWRAWRSIDESRSYMPNPWTGDGCNGTTLDQNNGGQVEVALVKTGPIAPGIVSGGVLLEAASATAKTLSALYTPALDGRKSFLVSSTAINVAACSTASVPVDLGSHQQSSFMGIGSTTPAVTFNVAVSNCAAGLNAIKYQFIPLTAVLDSSNGVLALSPGSTATGIGVQVKDRNGRPLKYNTQYDLAEYDKATGGTYNLPFSAAYYQTSNAVGPGSANSLLTFTMSYQ